MTDKDDRLVSIAAAGDAFNDAAEVTGFDVVEELRADPSTRETPIMVLTAAHLTEADKRQLIGRVSDILSRRSTSASDIVSLVRRLVRTQPSSP